MIIGYKGSETDAAAFYCPYIPLMSTGVMMDPNTTEPVVSFMTRYGYVELFGSRLIIEPKTHLHGSFSRFNPHKHRVLYEIGKSLFLVVQDEH
jgi:hypothetical protein